MDSDDDMLSASSGSQFLDGSDYDNSLDGNNGVEDDIDESMFYDRSASSSKKPYEVDYKPIKPNDIRKTQSAQVEQVSSVLDLAPETSAILLHHTRWNRESLMELYTDQPEKMTEKLGLGSDFSLSRLTSQPPGPLSTEVVDGFECRICFEGDDVETYAMRCGHRFCVDCYRHYLSSKVQEGESAEIQCPNEKCNRVVDSKTVEFLLDEGLKKRYHELLLRNYVQSKDNLRWCPFPDCDCAVECGIKKRELDYIVPTVHCAYDHIFCFGCGVEDHRPAHCGIVSRWLIKCRDDSETANWISANTKECPKCQSAIEKNGGCNHMRCRKCTHEFCWVCMGLWSDHGNSFYTCNTYRGDPEAAGETDSRSRSRASLDRYLHYYNRYANHEQSAKLDKNLYIKTEKKMLSLQSQSAMSWIEVQFLDMASRALQECRRTLKWTYAFAYYLQRNNMTEIFEDNQRDLEMAVENLSEMFEKPATELDKLRVVILDKTSYCVKRRLILLDDTAERLRKGEWVFNYNVDL